MNRFRNGCTPPASSSAAAPQYATGRALLLIASFFVLLLLAATISVQARAAATGSDNFIPTFLIYYSGGPTLVAADAQKLAKFDLIDIDRFRHADIGSNTWAAIKALNPAVQIYLYEMGSEAPSHLDSTAQLNLNGLGRHNVSRGHFMGSLNGNRPDLFLLDSTGNRVYDVGSSNPGANQYWYLMDFGATAYQSYWVAAVKADIIDQPWAADGVFANGCPTRASDGGYSAVPSLYPTSAAWSDATNDFASSITAGLFGYGQKLWCNRGGSRSVEGAAAWRALDQSASPPDVVMEEGAFAVSWGSGAVEFYPESEWKRQVDTLRAISNSKVAAMSHTRLLEGQSGTDNYGKTVTYWQALWYSLGSFLLAKNDVLGNAHFMFRGGSGYNKIWWHDEYEHIDLGKALGPYAVRKIGSVKVYWREFENGYVYVNPTARNVASVTLPQTGRRLTRANMSSAPDSIPSVSAISLNGHQAAFVLKVVAAPVPDTTAPAVPTGLTGSAVSPSQVNISWNPSTDNVGVTGYMVYLNDATLATTTTTSFSHTGLTPGTTYSYRVSAFDAVPNHSAWTATPVAVTTLLDTTAPSVTLAVQGAPDLPLNGTTTQVTVGFVSGAPTKVELSRDGLPVFATWPTDSFFTLSADGKSLTGNWCISSPCWDNVAGTHVLKVVATYAGGLTATASVTLNVVGTAPSVTLAVQGAPDLPLNGTTTQVTVGFVSGAPTKVELSRDGLPVFATWPTDSFFTLSADGKSLTGNWCISSPCWDNVAGTHVLKVVATYAGGLTATASVTLNVVDDSVPAPSAACANPAGGYAGFGSNTTGGVGQPVYRVTNLNDSGAGSLREALSTGNRCVVFDVAGTITLSSALLARGQNITIDGFTAPSPGITLTGWGFDWHGPIRGVANIIARGIRIRGTVTPESLGADGFQIVGVNNFVIDHVSIDQWGDGSLDIAGENGTPSQNGTIQWSIIGKGKAETSLLVKYGSRRISLHHNLLINSHDRSPYCAWDDDPALLPPADEIVCDFRNNLVLGYDWTGTSVRHRATANVVNNYYFSSLAPTADAALYIREGGVAYASGNYAPNGININALGNRATPFPADVPTTTDAITAAQQIVAQGGARGPNFGLDAADLNYIGQVSLP